MRKSRVIFEVFLMFTVGFCWYLYLTGEVILWNARRRIRKRWEV